MGSIPSPNYVARRGNRMDKRKFKRLAKKALEMGFGEEEE